MSRITFLTGQSDEFKDVLHYHSDIRFAINFTHEDIVVSDLSFLSFDLFDRGFSEIHLFHNGELYELRLGKNTWTEKELRKEHNLLKLVRSYFLNK